MNGSLYLHLGAETLAEIARQLRELSYLTVVVKVVGVLYGSQWIMLKS